MVARSVSSLETYQYRWNIAPLAMLCMCGRAQSDPILRTCTDVLSRRKAPARWSPLSAGCGASTNAMVRRYLPFVAPVCDNAQRPLKIERIFGCVRQ
jgi:hypothetical protein